MFEEWVAAENFYTIYMPLMLIFLSLLFFVYILFVSYLSERKRLKKYANISLVFIIISCLGYFFLGHSNYNFWVEQNEYINAGIREYSFIFGWKSSEDPQIVKSLGKSNLLHSNLLALEMYDGKQITRPFNHNYLGTRGNDNFFSMGENNQYVYRIRGDVNWETDKNEIRGWEFTLDDTRFNDLGFVNDFNIIFDSLSISTKKQTEFEIEDHQIILSIDEIFDHWVFSNQTY